MPRPANWKSDGPTRIERVRHLSWAYYRDIWGSYADYLAQVQPRGGMMTTISRSSREDALDADAATSRHEERHAKKFPGRDIGIHGHPEAVAYKINKKAMGLA